MGEVIKVAIVGVIPAAGYATRLQPLNCSKEVLPVRGRPVMDYLIERMRRANCDELRVVTRPEKEDVIRTAQACGATVILGRPETAVRSMALGMAGLAADDIVLLGFPDSIWDPVDGYLHLLALLASGHAVALGLFQTSEPARGDVVTCDGDSVTQIDIKPEQPSSTWIWGCAATTVARLAGADAAPELSVHLNRLCRDGLVGGVRLQNFVDIGTKSSLKDFQAT